VNCPDDPSVSSRGAVAQSGTSQSLSLLSENGKKPWILDSGATDHLTGSSDNFLSYHPCVGHEKIRIVDRSFAPVASKGHISPFDDLILQNVLHVPKISYNLLSVSKITRDLNYHVAFSLDNVVFQDLSLGTMIGTTQHNRGFYFLEDDTYSRNSYRTSLLSSYFSTSEKDCMLCHFRFGHPKFQ